MRKPTLESVALCCAKIPGGYCLKPARFIDLHRGGLVCVEHRPTKAELVAASKSKARRDWEEFESRRNKPEAGD